MSRDFLLVLGGGVVSLFTTLIVLFITDWVYRRDLGSARDIRTPKLAPPPTGNKEVSS